MKLRIAFSSIKAQFQEDVLGLRKSWGIMQRITTIVKMPRLIIFMDFAWLMASGAFFFW